MSATQAGQLGITVDAAGRPVAVVLTCAKATPVIDLSEGRTPSMRDDEPNVHRGTWTARIPFSGVRQVSLVSGTEGWAQDGTPASLPSDRLFVLTGGTTEDDNAYLSQVSFRSSELTSLTPGQVRVEGKVETVSEFGSARCQ